MPSPITAREFDKVINKFGFETRETSHVHAMLRVDGKVVVKTRRSRQTGDLRASNAIRQQLHLNDLQLTDAIRCPLGQEGYLAILAQKGILPER